MYVLMRHAAGITVEGLILASNKNRMRVVMQGFADAVELKRRGNDWLDPHGLPMEFDFVMSTGRQSEGVRSVRTVTFTHAAAR